MSPVPIIGGDKAAEEAVNKGIERAKIAKVDWPRITIVTPVFNGERFLEETIRSIVDQGYPNLEYIIVDDGSTDGTAEIIKQYEPYLSRWITQANQGMYVALNAGFAQASGEIMGWVNANDKLHTKGLFIVGSVFGTFPEVKWITGRPTVFDNEGMTVMVQDLPHWSRKRFLAGANRYIQQESTFWRRSLWEMAGGYLSPSYRAAGDFELWTRFFRHTQLYSVDALIGGWRFHSDSASHRDLDVYNKYCDEILEAELRRTHVFWSLALLKSAAWLRRVDRLIERIPKVRLFWRWMIMDNFYRLLYKKRGPDWAPTIAYRYPEDRWSLRRE